MASISQNQYDYLNSLVSAGGGNGEWAKAQLAGVTPPTPQQAAQSSSSNNSTVYAPAASTSKPAASTSAYASTTPGYTMPSYNYTSSAPVYTPSSSTPSYTSPSTSNSSSSYTGAANIIGNVSGSTDTNKSYQNIYDSYRANNPGVNQINTWADNTGNVYNTTTMTPQQTYALMLNKNGQSNASDVLKGMGLDINGNPVYAPPAPTYTKNAQVDAMPIDQQLSYYAAHPSEAQQEIARAQGVGGSAAQTWVNQLRGMVPQDTGQQGSGQQGMSSAATTNNGATQLPGGAWAPAGSNQLSQSQIDQEAQYKINKERADLRNTADTMLGSLKNNASYANQLLKDSRVLENLGFQRNSNPFSGKTEYAAAQLTRGRDIDDTYRAAELTNQMNSIEKDVYNFDKLSADKQRALINEMTRLERSYGLEVANQTGILNGMKTLAGKDQEFNQARQTKVDNWNAYMDSIGLTGNLGSGAKADWSLLGGTGGTPTLAAKSTFLQQEGQRINNEIASLELANLPTEQKLKIQQLQKQIAEIGRAPYKDPADAELDKIKIDTAREQLRQLKEKPSTPTGGSFNLDDFKSQINQNFYTENTDPISGQKSRVFDSTGARKYIIGLGMPDDQTDQLLKIYGLPTN